MRRGRRRGVRAVSLGGAGERRCPGRHGGPARRRCGSLRGPCVASRRRLPPGRAELGRPLVGRARPHDGREHGDRGQRARSDSPRGARRPCGLGQLVRGLRSARGAADSGVRDDRAREPVCRLQGRRRDARAGICGLVRPRPGARAALQPLRPRPAAHVPPLLAHPPGRRGPARRRPAARRRDRQSRHPARLHRRAGHGSRLPPARHQRRRPASSTSARGDRCPPPNRSSCSASSSRRS